MKPQPQHSAEDQLLDFAYGELPAAEVRALEAHLGDCPRCSEALRQIRSVRAAMAPLREQSAPEAGLDSLLAYAQQSARRNAEAPAPARRGWRRLLVPAAGLAAASLFGVVVLRVNEQVDLSQPEPAQVAAKAEPQYAEPEPFTAESDSVKEAPARASAPAEKDAARYGGALADRSGAEVRRRKAEAPSERRKVLESKSARMDEEEAAMPAPAAEPLAEAQEAPEQAREEGATDAVAGAAAPAAADSAAAGARAPSAAGTASRGAAAPSAAAPAPAAAQPSRKAKAAQDPALLTREAERARASGDRAREALLLREALAAGAKEPALLLRKLCEAELSLGRNAAAAEACRAVVRQSPGSAEARSAQRILDQLGASSSPVQ